MRKIKFLVLILVFLSGIYSCQKEEGFMKSTVVATNAEDTLGKIVLGKKLENPYSVKNMKKALESLIKKKQVKASDMVDFEITTTHLYIEMAASENANLDVFAADTSLELFNYPLDYALPEEGSFYQDTTFTNYDPAWLYTAVPVDYDLSNLKYKILEECYLPDINLAKGDSKSDFLKKLEYESYLITGNLDKNEKTANYSTTKSRHSPQGTIQVYNSTGNLEGVKGVKVRVHNFIRWDSDMTDGNGYYSISNGYLTNVHYALIFKNSKDFKVWGNWAFIAPAHYYMGWHSPTGIDRTIYQNSAAWKWATVNNAVYAYYNLCSTFAISKPPSDLRIWVVEKGGSHTISGNAGMLKRTWGLYGFNTNSKLNNWFNWMSGINIVTSALGNTLLKFVAPDIGISINTSNVGTPVVYNTVFHECAHASHWTKVGSYYWTKYINYILSYGSKDNPYGNGQGNNAGYCGVGEMWGNYIGALFQREYFNYGTSFTYDWWYFNEEEYWYNPGFLKDVDNIPDVTTGEIYSCLTSSTNTISKLVTQLKTKTNYVTQVDAAYNKAIYNDWP